MQALPKHFLKLLGLTASAASTFTVNSTGDGADSNTADGICNDGTGSCTLRAAIQQASAAGGDTVNFNFPAASQITLTNGELPIAKSLTITGPGTRRLTVSGNQASRVFIINSGTTVVISGLTISRGSAGFGGGINNGGGVLTINDCSITDNTAATSGGGINNNNGGTLTLNNVTVSDNHSGDQAGGVFNSGIVFLTNSTVSTNSAVMGGGISNVGSLTLSSSTVASNSATNFAGGIENPGIGAASFTNTIIAANTATSSPDCGGANLNSQDYNLIGDTSGCSIGGTTTHNITNVSPGVGPLGDNGGPTRTHALLAGSPAIDKGNSSLGIDQRGFQRPFDFAAIPNAAGGNGSDIGAFEAQPPAPLLISEFRFSGGNEQDEFVELYNNTDQPLTVSTTDGSSGWSLVSRDGGASTIRFTITNGTVIPARGHYLGATSPFIGGYQLTGYAVPDQSMVADISNGAGIAIFRTSNPSNFTLANRFDAVGYAGVTDPLYFEGTPLEPSGGIAPTVPQYSWVRDLSSGTPKDTNNNSADFRLVSTDGGVLGGVQSVLGAPGPEARNSPIQRNAQITLALLDATTGQSVPPNRVRDFTSNSANNSTFGTLSIRRRVTNNTGANVTRLRFRVITITGFPVADAATADLRAISSSDIIETVNDPAQCAPNPTPCSVTVRGTTLEVPPFQPNGGGLNSSLSVAAVTTAPVTNAPARAPRRPAVPSGVPIPNDTITLGAPLTAGQSINVQFMLGIQKTGNFRFYVNVEALP